MKCEISYLRHVLSKSNFAVEFSIISASDAVDEVIVFCSMLFPN